MKAISIRQPWAWLILNADKDIENRVWRTRVRGRVLVHAAKGMTRREYEDGEFAFSCVPSLLIDMPRFEQLERGGIVGAVDIVDCVQASSSPWFEGPHGFVLQRPEQLPFMPLKGSLGFFDVPDELVPPSTCRKCGCSWFQACPGGCSWVAPGLCSACA